ncbi:MAG: hypothetical protein DRK00_04720 [Thermoprotei archaeon]|nr:MAG: hypothetical protein DRK00_04720 [Thermoprotei archaeon]
MIQLRADGTGTRLLLTLAVVLACAGVLLLLSPEERRPSITEASWIELRNETLSMNETVVLANRLERRVVDYVYLVIPMNTSFQKCYIIYMSPERYQLRKDEDGNVFAVFRIEAEPGERVTIKAVFRIEKAEYRVLWDRVSVRWPSLSTAIELTGATAMWDVKNETLRIIAEEYGVGDTPLDVVTSLAQWVKEHLEYQVLGVRLGSDHAVVERGGRLVVRGDCVEVCDVFVTLARIRGIPARAAFGFLLTSRSERMWLNFTVREEGKELLLHWGGHMWPQVLIEPVGWIDVELLEGGDVKVGDYSWRHVLLGVEETRYYGTALSNFCIPGSLTLEYVEVIFGG